MNVQVTEENVLVGGSARRDALFARDALFEDCRVEAPRRDFPRAFVLATTRGERGQRERRRDGGRSTAANDGRV